MYKKKHIPDLLFTAHFFSFAVYQKKLSLLRHEFLEFLQFLGYYLKKKWIIFSTFFESRKNTIVKGVLIKRGKRNRMFLHVSAMGVLTIGVVVSPLLSDSNPFSGKKNALIFAEEGVSESTYLLSEDVFNTEESEKPRDKVIEYTVQRGDTLSTIAQKFKVSEETIKWENDLKTDSIAAGDILRILPVSGVAHKVASGDTVYSIAKKYDANPQETVDFPFNDFANPQTFSLVAGQILIVPNGVKPEEKPKYVRPRYLASGPVAVSGSGWAWPIQGLISQFFSWYHPGVDITSSVGAPVVSAQSGKVIGAYSSGWHGGYGIHVIVQGDSGNTTLYAHMSGLNVSVGDTVTAGRTTVGWVGMTGRTTGPHLHFEVRGGSSINPLAVLGR